MCPSPARGFFDGFAKEPSNKKSLLIMQFDNEWTQCILQRRPRYRFPDIILVVVEVEQKE